MKEVTGNFILKILICYRKAKIWNKNGNTVLHHKTVFRELL